MYDLDCCLCLIAEPTCASFVHAALSLCTQGDVILIAILQGKDHILHATQAIGTHAQKVRQMVEETLKSTSDSPVQSLIDLYIPGTIFRPFPKMVLCLISVYCVAILRLLLFV